MNIHIVQQKIGVTQHIFPSIIKEGNHLPSCFSKCLFCGLFNAYCSHLELSIRDFTTSDGLQVSTEVLSSGY
jgi:hypothetical protein